jgi:hypothetical protein
MAYDPMCRPPLAVAAVQSTQRIKQMEKASSLGIRTDGCAGAKIDFSYVLVTLYFALRPQRQTELCEKDGREAEL